MSEAPADDTDTSSSSSKNMNLTGASICEDVRPPNEARDIFLPNQTEHVSQISVDIGGSLAKVVYFTSGPGTTGGRLNFKKFETDHIELCIDFITTLLEDARCKYYEENGITAGTQVIMATGGGAHLFYDMLQERLPGIVIQKEDEMDCLITGLNFFITEIPYEVFTYSESDPMAFEETPKDLYPYMLVNIGSGVSILKVTGPDQFQRISGTSLGGGTLWGLLSLLTGAQTFDEMLDASQNGDNRNVDMLVGDIYGTDYSRIGLKSSTIASSFGKVFKRNVRREQGAFKNEDISRSLLYMVSNNIGQIAYLNAEKHGLNRIYFGGCFIRGHPITMNTLSYAIGFWSKGQMKALFLRHEGYLGAFGAFLKHHPIRRERHSFSFSENFTVSQKISGESQTATGVLERMPNRLTSFPLLDDSAYLPDTFELVEPHAQRYWIDILESGMDHLVEMAAQWEGEAVREKKGERQMEVFSASSEEAALLTGPPETLVEEEKIRNRLAQFSTLFKGHLARLRSLPNMYGALTVRSLLNLREQCLRELGFPDIFWKVKRVENQAAFRSLRGMLDSVDAIKDERGRVKLLIENILAGNMFDWGSNQILELLKSGLLNFQEAKNRVRLPESTQFNTLDAFLDRVVSGHSYRKVVIFVDNSGADIVLGVLPFARYLLRKGADVILAANSFPAVNDVTASELKSVMASVAELDETIARASIESRLIVMGTGSASPCIDLRRINEDLAAACKDVELVILEGMGRAIHTNYHARFMCDSLKIGVFKSPEVAKQLGAQMYDGLVLYCAGEMHPNENGNMIISEAGDDVRAER